VPVTVYLVAKDQITETPTAAFGRVAATRNVRVSLLFDGEPESDNNDGLLPVEERERLGFTDEFCMNRCDVFPVRYELNCYILFT
jgi:hypothetical protein